MISFHTLKKHVYFMRPVGMLGPIKVGCSGMVVDRLQKVNLWSPFELELIYHTEGEHIVERMLHERYKSQRKHGEWFHYEGLLKADVDRLISGEQLSSVVGFDVRSVSKAEAERRRTRDFDRANWKPKGFAQWPIEAQAEWEIKTYDIKVGPRGSLIARPSRANKEAAE